MKKNRQKKIILKTKKERIKYLIKNLLKRNLSPKRMMKSQLQKRKKKIQLQQKLLNSKRNKNRQCLHLCKSKSNKKRQMQMPYKMKQIKKFPMKIKRKRMKTILPNKIITNLRHSLQVALLASCLDPSLRSHNMTLKNYHRCHNMTMMMMNRNRWMRIKIATKRIYQMKNNYQLIRIMNRIYRLIMKNKNKRLKKIKK